MSYFANTEAPRPSLKRPCPFGDEQSPRSFLPTQPSSQQDIVTETICFGSIVDVKAQLRSLVPRLSRWAEGSIHSFIVVQEGDYFSLEYDGSKFARLNKRSCSDLQALVTQRQVRFKAYLQNKEWAAAVQSWHQRQTSSLFSVEINIYGARADAEEVGNILSKSGTFLQLPRYGLDDAVYYNPHFLRIEGYSEQVPLETHPSAIVDVVGTPDRTVEEESQVNDSVVVDSILDSLSHHVFLRQITVDRRIKSELLAHQKEAIDFISRREMGQLTSELSLWKYNDLDADEPFFQHVFSGAKRPQRDEAKGGIIADDMGLGKSLVILSTIAGSLDRAKEFVSAENQLIQDQPQRKVASGATLILAPSSLLIDSWVDEIRKHTYAGGLSFHKHLGQGRHAETNLLQERAIVFTTYATVAAEFSRGENTLAKIKWFRIVLDEAHDIRNRLTNQFQAVVSLSAQHRWCLTGTPIQNSLEDLGSLVSFLKVPILENAPTFRKFITNPTASKLKTRFDNLRTLLQTICLRRTRELLNLPEPVPQIRKLPLTHLEQAEYDNLVQRCRTEIDMAVSGHRKGKINSTVLQSLLTLRLFCNNGSANAIIRTGPTGLPSDVDEALTYLQQHGQNVCAYCSGTIYSISEGPETDGGIFMPSCTHLVCRSCAPHHRARKGGCRSCVAGNDSTLPVMPSSNAAQFQSFARIENTGFPPSSQFPSKLLALLSDIRMNPTHKSIVFSSWKKTLKLVGQLLDTHAIRYNLIDGSLTLANRRKVLDDFRSPEGANILLMTLGTGAEGLNLAVARRIYLLEPQWNPSIESQAIGRALRLGQTDQVVIVRYIMKGTVEESNVLSRQRTKLRLAGDGFNKGKNVPSERIQSALNFFGFDLSSTS